MQQADTGSGSLSNRRRGSDRRKHIDPRYRNPAYPAFQDRRKAQRRRPVYDLGPVPLINEHGSRKRTMLMGAVTAFFLLYASLLTNLAVDDRLVCRKKASVDARQALSAMFCGSF